MKLRTTRTRRRERAPWFVRALNSLRLRGRTKRCGDFYLDEPPPDMGVREPRAVPALPRLAEPRFWNCRRRTPAGIRDHHLAIIRKAGTGCGCDQCPDLPSRARARDA